MDLCLYKMCWFCCRLSSKMWAGHLITWGVSKFKYRSEMKCLLLSNSNNQSYSLTLNLIMIHQSTAKWSITLKLTSIILSSRSQGQVSKLTSPLLKFKSNCRSRCKLTRSRSYPFVTSVKKLSLSMTRNYSCNQLRVFTMCINNVCTSTVSTRNETTRLLNALSAAYKSLITSFTIWWLRKRDRKLKNHKLLSWSNLIQIWDSARAVPFWNSYKVMSIMSRKMNQVKF